MVRVSSARDGFFFLDTYRNSQVAEFCGQVQRRVGVAGQIGALQTAGIVLDDALGEGEVIEVDRTPEADSRVNHFVWSNGGYFII